jgi:hypothetical protein
MSYKETVQRIQYKVNRTVVVGERCARLAPREREPHKAGRIRVELAEFIRQLDVYPRLHDLALGRFLQPLPGRIQPLGDHP